MTLNVGGMTIYFAFMLRGIIMCKFFKLHLEDYFNHKIIGDENVIKNISSLNNIGISGCFFCPDMLPDSLKEIVIDNVPYTFPDKSPEKYDNVACEEQIIITPVGKYSAAYFLGLCEWGDFKENLKLKFNNCCEEAEVFFYDWWGGLGWFMFDYNKTNKNCKIALKATILDSSARGIYCYKCNIKCTSKDLHAIELPYNPNMHIFAITLEQG